VTDQGRRIGQNEPCRGLSPFAGLVAAVEAMPVGDRSYQGCLVVPAVKRLGDILKLHELAGAQIVWPRPLDDGPKDVNVGRGVPGLNPSHAVRLPELHPSSNNCQMRVGGPDIAPVWTYRGAAKLPPYTGRGYTVPVVHNETLDGFRFAPLRSSDLPDLAVWLARPHVARWWREPSDLVSVEQNYGPLAEGLDPTEGFIVHFSGRPIGYVQRYLIDEHPDWRETIRGALGQGGGIGIDYLIGEPDLVGRGIGRRLISQFVDASWNRYPSAERIVVALQQENIGSWKALEATGFRRVWEGDLASSDPSDQGPTFIYIADRNQD
jgi:aminoglycoside 6'-N-acetyltransferase